MNNACQNPLRLCDFQQIYEPIFSSIIWTYENLRYLREIKVNPKNSPAQNTGTPEFPFQFWSAYLGSSYLVSEEPFY